jgi:S-adenosylmethionine:tRNA ribosyltransferase-isomerase
MYSISVIMPEIEVEDPKLEDFAYDLPPHLIAQEPSKVRHESRLLYLGRKTGQLSHHVFKDIVDLLRPDDFLVVNDTKVIPARLFARRESGGLIEILLIRPQSKSSVWLAMGSPLKRLKVGERLTLCQTEKQYTATVIEFVLSADGHKQILLDLGSEANIFSILQEVGYAPLPPYIHRQTPRDQEENENIVPNDEMVFHEEKERARDIDRYQTVFASIPGAVAAPTAGLHFSNIILEAIRSKGVEIGKITLHVGPGTFKPITSSVEDHQVEPETLWISEDVAERVNRAKAQGRRVIAVGTTTCRALESAYSDGRLRAYDNQSTSLYIKPRFNFQVIDGLVTNFHLSKSSLLVLVAAFAGCRAIMNAYKVAIENQYRFYSYGDAMLIS